MKFHLPSFLLGCATGAALKALSPRLKPLFVQLATAGFKLADAVTTQAARRREDLQDLIAEAKARARGETRVAPAPSN
jgi:hypothetical protein